MDFKDQVFLISGGAGYFGEFLCEYCLTNGAKKVVLIDKDSSRLAAVKSRFEQIDVFNCDLTDFSATRECVNQITSLRKITVLINNAGLIHSEPLLNLLSKDSPHHSFENWERTIKSNLYTCFNLTSLIASSMAKSRTKGVIINMSSIAAEGNVGQTAYSAAKAGIESMTKTWSRELGIFKIRSVAIAPGFINTPSTSESLSEQVLDKWKKQVPLGSLGELEHVGMAVRFIVENDYINGKVIPVDGGLRI